VHLSLPPFLSLSPPVFSLTLARVLSVACDSEYIHVCVCVCVSVCLYYTVSAREHPRASGSIDRCVW